MSKRYISQPHYTTSGCNKLGQCTSVYCAPHSAHQLLRKFGITKFSEKQIAAVMGTTSAGTGHAGINTFFAWLSKQTGKKFSVQWKNFSDLGANRDKRFEALGKLLEKKNIGVITHIGYQGNGNKASGTIFGHYEVLNIVNTGTKYVRALNSLGTKNKDGSYQGHPQDRTFELQAHYIANMSQASVCIVTME